MLLRMRDFTEWLPTLPVIQDRNPIPPFLVGPELPSDIPGEFVLVSPAPGPGLSTEDLLEGAGVQFRVVGEQGDYDGTEWYANTIDRVLLSQVRPRVGGVLIHSILRTGGGPAPDRVDEARRHHFVCSYVLNTASGITGGG